MIKTQFGKPVKIICTDNGGGFTSNDMQRFYNEREILLETTCPHTPQKMELCKENIEICLKLLEP